MIAQNYPGAVARELPSQEAVVAIVGIGAPCVSKMASVPSLVVLLTLEQVCTSE